MNRKPPSRSVLSSRGLFNRMPAFVADDALERRHGFLTLGRYWQREGHEDHGAGKRPFDTDPMLPGHGADHDFGAYGSRKWSLLHRANARVRWTYPEDSNRAPD